LTTCSDLLKNATDSNSGLEEGTHKNDQECHNTDDIQSDSNPIIRQAVVIPHQANDLEDSGNQSRPPGNSSAFSVYSQH